MDPPWDDDEDTREDRPWPESEDCPGCPSHRDGPHKMSCAVRGKGQLRFSAHAPVGLNDPCFACGHLRAWHTGCGPGWPDGSPHSSCCSSREDADGPCPCPAFEPPRQCPRCGRTPRFPVHTCVRRRD